MEMAITGFKLIAVYIIMAAIRFKVAYGSYKGYYRKLYDFLGTNCTVGQFKYSFKRLNILPSKTVFPEYILPVFVSILEAETVLEIVNDSFSDSFTPNFKLTSGMSMNLARTLIGLICVVVWTVGSISISFETVVVVVECAAWATPDAPWPWHCARNVWSAEYFEIAIFHGL